MNRIATMGLLSGMMLLASAAPADAQRVRTDMRQKSTWYSAPKEFQIIDERPVIKDFREAPQAPQTIELPPPPAGFNGAGGAAGSGAAVSGPMQLGGPNQGFRAASGPALPSAAFGKNSNMGSLHTPAKLPSGNSSNLMGRMARPSRGQAAGMGRAAGPSAGHYSNPVKSYGGGYGAGSGSSSGGSAMRTDTMVRGTLLKR